MSLPPQPPAGRRSPSIGNSSTFDSAPDTLGAASTATGQEDGQSDKRSGFTTFVTPRDPGRQPSILPPSAFFSPATKRPNYDATGTEVPTTSFRVPTPSLPLSPIGLFPEDDDRYYAPSSSSGVEPAPVGRSVSPYLPAEPSQRPAPSRLSSTTGHTPLQAYDTRSREPLLDRTKNEPLPPPTARIRSGSQGNGAIAKASHEKPATPKGSRLHQPVQGDSQSGHVRTRKRNYAQHDGSNRFFLNGLIMTADANPTWFLFSLFVLLVLGGLWLGFEAPYQWHHISPAAVIVFAYLFGGTTVHMLVTAWRDPGVVPRNLDPEPLLAQPSGSVDLNPADPEDPIYTPLPRVVRVRNGQDMTVKWCETCKVYRPPRSSHCRVCDNCVEGIDHHCTFLNTCIARRNYVSFFAFLLYAIASSCLGIAMCAVHLHRLTLPSETSTLADGETTQDEGTDFSGALKKSPMSGVLFILLLAVLVPLLTLTSYHIRLILMNRTTVEQIRINTAQSHTYPRPSCAAKTFSAMCCGCCAPGQSDTNGMILLGDPEKDPNPFAHRNPLRNAASVLCRPSVTVVGHYARRRGGSTQQTGRTAKLPMAVRPGAAALDRRGYVWEDTRGHHALDVIKQEDHKHVPNGQRNGHHTGVHTGTNGLANDGPAGGPLPAPPLPLASRP
ncbi:unnamed protein product [Parajaminaea phylloscopi]